jgi:hypothetical protein
LLFSFLPPDHVADMPVFLSPAGARNPELNRLPVPILIIDAPPRTRDSGDSAPPGEMARPSMVTALP